MDLFGDRMKGYEAAYTSARVLPPDVLCVRIDGKGFSKFTRGFVKPFDEDLTWAMVETTRQLVKETHANIGYTQSDEITLIFTPGDKASEYIFGGKVSKINSILASMAAVSFNYFLEKRDPVARHGSGLAYFDCRAWSVPNEIEASNVLLWRAQDARKNSVSSLFRWTAGHRAMDGLDQAGMKNYLLEKHDVDWNDLPDKWRYGTYVKSVTRLQELNAMEMMNIPKSKLPADLMVRRSAIEEIPVGYYGDLSLEARISLIERNKRDEPTA